MSWKTNSIMEWSLDGGTTWNRISDHGRAPLTISVERIENKQRMADGTLRRYTVAKKRTFSTSWDNLPSKAGNWLANGEPGEWMENVHDTEDGSFHIRLREGDDIDLTLLNLDGDIVEVMISDFNKDVSKRGRAYDLWNLDISLEEV